MNSSENNSVKNQLIKPEIKIKISSNPPKTPETPPHIFGLKPLTKDILTLASLTTLTFLLILLSFLLFTTHKKPNLKNLLISQSFVEDNEVDSFTLPNALKVILIKPNSGIKNSYISLSVGVGSETDPADFIGFTHLIEHLLFTGSKNYPIDNYIEKIVNKYNGDNNGVTKAFTTSYYYSLEREGFEEFSDVLVDAVKEPLFDREMIRKEINNVNSEISMRMTFNKNLAYYKMVKKIGNYGCHLFSDGFANIDPTTVDLDQLRREIIEFHEKYYSANIMTLAVISDDNMEDIRDIIEKTFSKIPDKGIVRDIFDDPEKNIKPFDKSTLNSVYFLRGYSFPTSLSMIFPIASEKKSKDFHALEFFSTYLNYYSDNSFKQTLVKEKLILSYSDQIVLQDYSQSLYMISFDLTEKGEKNMTGIIEKFFAFIRMIKELNDKESFYDSLAKISKFDFLFNTQSQFLGFSNVETNPFDRVLTFSENLQTDKAEDMFILNNILNKYNAEEFEELLDSLNPDNSLFIIESPKFKERKKKKVDKDLINRRNKQKEELEKKEKIEESSIVDRLLTLIGKGRNLSAIPKKKMETDLSKDEIFNNCLETQKLSYEFDFDNNRAYTYLKLPKKIIKEISETSKTINANYEVLNKIETDHIKAYDIITKCKVPKTLAISDEEKLSNAKLNKLIFSKKSPKEYYQKISLMKDLITYKFCMIIEFLDDDKKKKPEVLKENKKLDIYYKLYRKTLQPKYIVTIELESKFLIEHLVNSDNKGRMKTGFMLDLFCIYLQKHMELKYHKEFMKGNDFSCDVSNYHLVFQFEGVTKELDKFVRIILEHFELLMDEGMYDLSIIENLKERIINKYSDFSSITSLKMSMYYLQNIMDKLFVDYSSREKFEHLAFLINDINETDLAKIMSNILTDNKLSFIYVGNIEKNLSIEYTEKFTKYLNLDYLPKSEIDILSYRKIMTEKLVLKLPKQKHLLARTTNIDPNETNNVYLTYFKIGILTKKQKIFGLTLNHFLSKKIFDQLRNKMNLGYVAHSGLKVYYHNLGLMVLIQGENFRPHKIEKAVDQTLKEFIENIKTMELSDIKNEIENTVNDIVQFPDDLDEVASKIYYHLEEEKVNLDSSDYMEILENVGVQEFYDFAYNNLVRDCRRVTIELFAKEVREEEMMFRMLDVFSLDQRSYDVVPIEIMQNLKFME